MLGVLKTLAQIVIGIGIAGVVLAIVLPPLIKAGYLAVGSPAGFWTIWAVIAVCILLTLFRPRRSPRRSESGFDD